MFLNKIECLKLLNVQLTAVDPDAAIPILTNAGYTTALVEGLLIGSNDGGRKYDPWYVILIELLTKELTVQLDKTDTLNAILKVTRETAKNQRNRRLVLETAAVEKQSQLDDSKKHIISMTDKIDELIVENKELKDDIGLLMVANRANSSDCRVYSVQQSAEISVLNAENKELKAKYDCCWVDLLKAKIQLDEVVTKYKDR